jgi:4,5-DOPA dioxygenase extradiol
MLAALAREMPRPRAILVASAHWEAEGFRVGSAARPATIHDFGGFPAALYALEYPAPGDPELARAAARLIAGAGLAVSEDPGRGLDHGAWVPLSLMYPPADIPVATVSLWHGHGPAAHFALGRALAPLTDSGVLVLGSGGLTHDLSRVWNRAPDAAADPTIAAFADWMETQLADGDLDALLDYRRRAPHARAHHPTEEHLLPLFVALGAAGDGARLTRRPGGTTYGVLSMDAYVAGPRGLGNTKVARASGVSSSPAG